MPNRVWMSLGALALCLPLVSCSSEDGQDDLEPATQELADLVPDEYKDSGVLQGASSFSVPPNYYYESGNKPAGMVIEMMELAASKLGLRIEWRQVPYDGILAALDTGKIDVTGSQFSPNEEVLEKATGISAWYDTNSILVQAGNPLGIEEVDDLCGVRLAYTGGGGDALIGDMLGEYCEDKGLPALDKATFKDAASARTALQSGQVDAQMVGAGPAKYAADNSDLEIVIDHGIGRRPSGTVVKKDNLPLARALQAAWEESLDDGSYAKLMEKWDNTANSTEEILLNDPGPGIELIVGD